MDQFKNVLLIVAKTVKKTYNLDFYRDSSARPLQTQSLYQCLRSSASLTRSLSVHYFAFLPLLRI